MESPKVLNKSYLDLYLDPKNPRLGRHFVDSKPSQEEIQEKFLREYALPELAVSFIESGFWPQEALVVVSTQVPGVRGNKLVVIEGNRRLAALKQLWKAHQHPDTVSKTWQDIAESAEDSKMDALKDVPYVMADSREKVQAYLGFRHVSGIKEWAPAEKAEFIAHLIDDQSMDYEEVRRKIGSKQNTVRQHYIAYRILIQLETQGEYEGMDKTEKRFSVFYLSLRTSGVREYLGIDLSAEPKNAKQPVPKRRLKKLLNHAKWLFGTNELEPLFTDSRKTDQYGTILESSEAIAYLERTVRPNFDTAYRLAGGDVVEAVKLVEQAADALEESLSVAHRAKKDKKMQRAVKRMGQAARQLLTIFPGIDKEIQSED